MSGLGIVPGFDAAQARYDAQEPDWIEDAPDSYECAACDESLVEPVWSEGIGRSDRGRWKPERTCSGEDCGAALCKACAHESEFCPSCAASAPEYRLEP